MTIAILAVSRRGETTFTESDMARIARRLAVESPEDASLTSARGPGVLAATIFGGPYARQVGTSVAFGPVDDDFGWARAGAPLPSFASAVLRANDDTIELVSDAVGSRTIWYCLSEATLLASTSQRALIGMMGSFEMNNGTIPWMLATGLVGPELSWDKRITCLAPDATFKLHRATWNAELTRRPARWSTWTNRQAARTDDDIERLEQTLDETFRSFGVRDDMLLPISGGVDSRGILIFLRRHRPSMRIRGITWGTRSALENRDTDAYVARELCRAMAVDHRYHVLEPTGLGFPEIFRRFVANGEGRVDHISGYADGFALWKTLRDDKIGCLLRGDMAFGYPPAYWERDVRLQTPIPLIEDFENLCAIKSVREMEMPRPAHLKRGEGESCTAWNGRLGHEFRLPTTLAALTQLKTPYVEIVNPLLARPLVEVARTLPRPLFQSKRAFRLLVRRLSPPVPFATLSAIPQAGDVYGEPAARTFVGELLRNRGREWLPADIVDTFAAASSAPTAKSGRRRGLVRALMLRLKRAKAVAPPWVTSAVRNVTGRRIDSKKLAFRAALIAATCDLLKEDSLALSGQT